MPAVICCQGTGVEGHLHNSTANVVVQDTSAVVSLPRKRIQHAMGSAMDSATCRGRSCWQGSLDTFAMERAQIDVGMVLGGPCAVAPLVHCLDPKGGHHIAAAQLYWSKRGWAGSSPVFIFFLNLYVYSNMSEQLETPRCHIVLTN
ncbi:MAG: hypothetical protein FRX49_11772 [Trebouxia sp. A1-2]|nr:MAG: hypothetical protein FRX49_11772 [Trebouxia sp. A1-2]